MVLRERTGVRIRDLLEVFDKMHPYEPWMIGRYGNVRCKSVAYLVLCGKEVKTSLKKKRSGAEQDIPG